MNTPSPRDYAEELASSGCYVFPCKASEKLPAIKNWQKLASNDPRQVRQWATQFANCNWGVSADRFKDGALLVLDIDHRPDKDGEASLLALIAAHGALPPTFECASPNGRHLYFSVTKAVKQGVDVFGPGVDVRSAGGFVVAPGSVIPAGKYITLNTNDVAPAPAWLVETCGAPREKAADRTPLKGIDPVRAKQRGIDYLATAPRSVKGAGGDQCAYTVAAKLLALGLDEPGALDLMLSDAWDEGCGWSATRLAEKVAHAAKYMQQPIGADAPEAQFEKVDLPDPVTRHYNLLSVDALLARPPPSWLVRGLLPARGLGVVYGAPGSGKSFLVLDLAAAVARGISWAGARVKRGAVVYVGLEGQMGPRVSAYLREHGAQAGDVSGLHIIERQGLNLLQDERSDVSQLIADIKASLVEPVAMVIVDTLNRAMPGGNENASEDMGRAIKCAGELSAALDCLCVFVHHSGKDAGKGARGHSSLLGAADAEMEVSRGNDGDSRFLEATKVKDGEDGSRFGFRLKIVDLGATRDHDPDADESERDTSCVVEGLERATIGATGKARNWTPHRTNAMAALRLAINADAAGAIDWDGVGTCGIDEWRAAYRELVPVGDALEGTELRQATNTQGRNFTNAVGWLTAEKLVTVHKEKGRSVYRIEAVK